MLLVFKGLTNKIVDWEQGIDWPILSKHRGMEEAHNMWYKIVRHIFTLQSTVHFGNLDFQSFWSMEISLHYVNTVKSTSFAEVCFWILLNSNIKVFPILTCDYSYDSTMDGFILQIAFIKR